MRVLGAIGCEGTVTVRFTNDFGNVLADDASFRIIPPPEPVPAQNEGRAGAGVPEIYQVFRYDDRRVA